MRQKFSTRNRVLLAAVAVLVLATATAAADEPQLASQAPERYTVQKGDTLWDIAGKFLKEPWRWPEIWRMNREQIKDPHWIYPGDVIVLDHADGQWRLSVATPRPTVRVEPQARVTPLTEQPIPSIPPGDLEPYLSWPLVTGPDGLEGAAEIVAGREQTRVVRGTGDIVYAAGIDPKAGTLWRIYRPGATLTTLDGLDVLGYEQRFLGLAKVERFDTVSTLRIDNAREEILVGDKLLPSPREQLLSYVPHAPDHPVDGHVIALARDAAEVGRGWIVTIDKGAADGVDVGTVLAIYQATAPVPDPRPSNEPPLAVIFSKPTKFIQPERYLNLPDERLGLMFVFRVFDRVSYALVLNTTDPVLIGDYARKP
jgi:hypothetical protein